jgi:hypothetical protein
VASAAKAARPIHSVRAVGSAAAVLFVAVFIAVFVVTPTALAADPGSSPGPPASARPSCADRFPAEGPAGVDLQLGCIVNEIAATYLGTAQAPDARPPRLSDYGWPIGLTIAGLIALVVALRKIQRAGGRRLAPATPVAWWSCPSCRSLNVADRSDCYRCGAARVDASTEVRTDAEPPAPQSFGRRIGDD